MTDAKTTVAALNFVDMIIAVGSVDGICTTAAVLRQSNQDAEIIFTQAFQVDKIDLTEWADNRTVLFVDLAVNNQDKKMTADFLSKVTDAGHTIVGVLDEHNANDWREAFESVKLSFGELVIQPVSQKDEDIKSSGALLLSILGDDADEQTRALCEAADAGDRMDFSTHFGGLVNQSVKSAIWDNSRRVHLVKHFAVTREPDDVICGWIVEYKAILKTHQNVLTEREDLGDGIIRIDCSGKIVDMTTLMGEVYNLPGTVVCLVRGEMFNKAAGKKMVMASLGTRQKDFNILSAIQDAGVEASGFTSKANVSLENEVKAIEAVKKVLD